MKCRECNFELGNKPNKEWGYRNNYYQVKSFKCSNCGKTNMLYYHEDQLSHVIVPSKRHERKPKSKK